MADITTREEFKEYCMRRLGSPVINIEIDDNQVEDRIDDAIDYWVRNHMDGSERLFYVHTLTQNEIDNQVLQAPEDTIEVHKILPYSSTYGNDMFSIRYQIRLHDFAYRTPTDTASYFIKASYWDYVNELLSEGTTIYFTKYRNEIRLDMATSALFAEGDELVFDIQKGVYPETHPQAWNDEILKRYATAQIKRQWGENIKKYEQIQLPGNVTLNAEKIYEEAVQEIDNIENEMANKYQLPAMFMMG